VLLRRLRLGRRKSRIMRGGCPGDLERRLTFGWNADLVADRIVNGETQCGRPVRTLRDDMKRKRHLALLSDRSAAFVRETMWRRPQDRDRFDVLGFGEIKYRRHAAVTRVPPVSLPTGRKPNLDACAQQVWPDRASGDQP